MRYYKHSNLWKENLTNADESVWDADYGEHVSNIVRTAGKILATSLNRHN